MAFHKGYLTLTPFMILSFPEAAPPLEVCTSIHSWSTPGQEASGTSEWGLLKNDAEWLCIKSANRARSLRTSSICIQSPVDCATRLCEDEMVIAILLRPNGLPERGLVWWKRETQMKTCTHWVGAGGSQGSGTASVTSPWCK